jgi:hypothetical protein
MELVAYINAHEWWRTALPNLPVYLVSTGLGPFSLSHMPEGKVFIEAWLDVNGNKKPDTGEPQGKTGDFSITQGGVRDMNITLK